MWSGPKSHGIGRSSEEAETKSQLWREKDWTELQIPWRKKSHGPQKRDGEGLSPELPHWFLKFQFPFPFTYSIQLASASSVVWVILCFLIQDEPKYKLYFEWLFHHIFLWDTYYSTYIYILQSIHWVHICTQNKSRWFTFLCFEISSLLWILTLRN